MIKVVPVRRRRPRHLGAGADAPGTATIVVGALPRTGIDLTRWWFAMAATLVAIGVAVLALVTYQHDH